MTSNSVGFLADFLRRKNYLSTKAVRKLFNTISFLSQSTFLILAGYTTNAMVVVLYLTLSVGLGGCLSGGYMANFMDISSKYATIIMGISNTIATIPGCISPLMAGLLTSEHTLEEWRIVFYISGVLNSFGGTFFLLFASGSEKSPLTSYTDESEALLHVQASLSSCVPRRNSFEDDSDHSPVRKKLKVRFLMAVLSFLGLGTAYGMKITLSVAIVQIVQETYTVEKNGTTEEYPVFDWNTLEQGRLLSSFFWGYIITQLPGGVLSGQFGGKKIFGFGILLSTIFTLLTPLAATYGGLNWLMFVRIMIGMGEGVTYPAIVQFWSKWAPEMERTQLLALSLSGAYGGTVVAMPLSGLLAQYFGWESLFYVYGGFGCMWFLIWHFTAAETPELHPFISIEEQHYIERTRTDGGNLINFKDIPWKKIATSLPFYAIICAHFGENWGFYTLLTELPTYMKEILKFNIAESGVLSAIPYLAMLMTSNSVGFLADFLRRKKYLSTKAVRKLFNTISFLSQSTFLILAGYTTNAMVVVLYLTLSVGLGGCLSGGYIANFMDISSKYSVIIMGISNTIATIPGCISPLMAGLLTSEHTLEEWRIVFYISGVLNSFGGTFFLLFASVKISLRDIYSAFGNVNHFWVFDIFLVKNPIASKRYKMKSGSEKSPLTSYTDESEALLHVQASLSSCVPRRNSLEDDSDRSPVRKKFQVRFLMAVLSFLGLSTAYGMKITLSIAIVQMVQETYTVEKNGTTEEYPVFDWNTLEQGRLLSSFFWGYIITQLPGGVLSGQFGGKKIFGFGIFLSTIFTLLTPLAATYGGLNWLMFVRIMIGMGEGVTYPAIVQFWSKWAPEMERTQLLALSLSGAYGGTVVAMPLSGLLAQYFGWESLFYVYGGFGCMWFLIWHFTAAETPELHPFISIEEQRYIERTRTDGENLINFKDIPWKKIATSLPFYAIICAHFGENWGFYTLLTELPTYMKEILKFNIAESGVLSAIPYLVILMTSNSVGFLADFLRRKNYLSTKAVRKLFNTISFLSQSTFLILAGYTTNAMVVVLYLTLSVGLGGCLSGGYIANFMDISSKYAAIIMGISNTIATIPGCISPLMAGLLTSEHTLEEWRIVFYISGVLNSFGGTFFLLFASVKISLRDIYSAFGNVNHFWVFDILLVKNPIASKRYKMKSGSEKSPLTSYTDESEALLHVQASLSSCVPTRNSLEDDSDRSPVRKKFQVRFLMAVLSFLGLSNAYGMKITLSVAIVQMVQETYTVEKNGTTEEYPVFDWNTLEQGRLLSSFFWGYIITQLPGGVLSGQFGGKKIFGFGILLSTIFTLLTPLAATYGGLNWLMFVRIMIGMGEGVTYPAIVQFWSKWAPEMERTQLLALSLSGAYGGTVVAMPLSGLLAQYFGWESLFYVYGGFGCMWFLIWHFTAAETPELHPWRNLINFKDIPWKKIATSLPFYAIICAHFGENWGFYTLLTELPTYMKEILKFNIAESGVLSAIPYLVILMTSNSVGFLADFLRRKNYLSTKAVRKLFNTISFLSQSTFLILAGYTTNAMVVVLYLTLSVGLGGCLSGGYIANFMDISSKYATIIMGISNTIATIPGCISPLMAGLLTSEHTLEEWRIVFYISGVLNSFGGTFFLLFASVLKNVKHSDSIDNGIIQTSRKQFDSTNSCVPLLIFAATLLPHTSLSIQDPQCL
ncbi:Sialin [Nymphon striatum]|nr:Sialin [Nymphon striatum]